MASVNKLILVGRVGQDPALKVTETTAICNFSVATSEKIKGEETTTWHRIVCFNKVAEICEKYLKKGSMVYLEGKVSNRTYKNKEGADVAISEVIANSVQFLSKVDVKEDKPTDKLDDDIPW